MTPPSTSALTRTLEAARRKLLETGTRNRLIHVNRDNPRAGGLAIIHERSDELWRMLRVQGRRMRFRAMGSDRPGAGGVLMLAAPGAQAAPDSQLETPLGPEALARRLLRMAHDARTAEEEQGLNVLYLAMGFLRWREAPGAQVLREAPLILLPVQLLRNEGRSTFDLAAREDDLEANLPLQERLRQDFGITLPEIDETEGWTPGDYLARVEAAVSGQPGWQVDRDGMQLGFFSFAKLLMHRDLDPATWPEGAFEGHPLLEGLMARGFDEQPLGLEEGARLDDRLDPAQIIQVIDADASQTRVIEDVRAGASLVVQGPPGTGKSQTIANLIAAAAHDGKTVLFVAEKMAALSVVHDRLARAGLRDLCLELHSRGANKKAVVQELGRTLMAGAQPLPPGADPAALRATRDRLNAISDLLHQPLPPTGEAPFGALSQIIGFIGQGARPPAIPLAGLEALDAEARAAGAHALARLVAARARVGAPGDHPFREAGALDLQPTDLARLAEELRAARAALAAVEARARPGDATLARAEAWGRALEILAEAPARAVEAAPRLARATDPRIAQGLAAGADWAAARQEAEGVFAPAAFEIDPMGLRAGLSRGLGSMLGRLIGPYRGASAQLQALLAGPLPATAEARVALADRLVEIRRRRSRLAEDEAALAAALGPEWRGERTDFAGLAAILSWLERLRATGALPDPTALHAALAQLAPGQDARTWQDHPAGGPSAHDPATRDPAGRDAGTQDHNVSDPRGHAATTRDADAPVSWARDAGRRNHDASDLRAGDAGARGPDAPVNWARDAGARGPDAPVAATDTLRAHTPHADIPQDPDPGARGAALVAAVRDARGALAQVAARLALDAQAAGLGADAAIAPALARIGAMADAQPRYGEWAEMMRHAQAARRLGAGGVVAALERGVLEPGAAADEFAYACAEARWTAARAARPALDELGHLDRHDLVSLFRELEAERIRTTRTLILSRHFERLPRGTQGEMGLIRGEIARRRGHRPVRWLMRHAGAMVQRIKPVLLMSPISVAQFLPPGGLSFDLLVIDEASQIRPEDALGVIARARQVVVVGDQQQLPPTSFFDRLLDDEDAPEDAPDAPQGAGLADMESILSLCEARGLRARMLEWHYRSRDPSLIRVSNAEFYDDRLILPPSPLQLDPDYGLKFRRVAGAYAARGAGQGRAGTNRIEAEAVVAAMAAHARDWPDLSLGVVAFSKAQADLLAEIADAARRSDPALDALLREGGPEDAFVKNIENVQGDERDVILISVGYGPETPDGPLTRMQFGPVNGEGGERRLNVLFSRARVRCEVFASFDPGQIDLSRTTRQGPRVLKRFLDYAQTGRMEAPEPTGLGFDSPFEEDVARVIRDLGWLADPQVGTAGFRIDLGLRHPDRPGQYLLAVECDGAAYHAALWARERDRLRQDILETLGWRFHRIWSTDWFHRREAEIARLREALEAARAAAEAGLRPRGARRATPPEGDGVAASAPPASPDHADGSHFDSAHFDPAPPALGAAPYRRAELTGLPGGEPQDQPVAVLADLVARIVAVEGPVHRDEVARRIAAGFGKSRTGSRIAEAVARAVALAQRDGDDLRAEGPFLMTRAQAEAPPIRDRSAQSGHLLKAACLPPSEIAAAAARIGAESGAMTPDEMTRAVARLLGFQRVGPDLAQAIATVVLDGAGEAMGEGAAS